MENRRRKLIRWTSILVAAFTILLSVGSGMVAYSASQSEINAENEISNAYDQLEKAAIVHLLMQKVYACALNTIETVFYPEDAQAGADRKVRPADGGGDRKDPPPGQRPGVCKDPADAGGHQVYLHEAGRERAVQHHSFDESQGYASEGVH